MTRSVRLAITVAAAGALLAVAAGQASAAQFFSATGAITNADPTQTGRLVRDQIQDFCGTSNGVSPSGADPHHYDLYAFNNLTNAPICVFVRLSASGCANPLYSAAYVPLFNPAAVTANGVADPGDSPSGSAAVVYSFTAPPGPFAVNVHEVNAGAGCPSYALGLFATKPFATASPTISGGTQADQLQASTNGTWNGSPTFTRQWRRCDASGAGCTDIPGATSSFYFPTREDVGSTLRVRLSATEDGETSSADSAQTPVIGPDTIPPQAPTLLGTDPPSGSNENAPRVKASSTEGRTQIRLFGTADCSGEPIGTGSSSELIDPGIPVQVPDNSTTQITANATDSFNNVSPCSGAISYTEVTPDTSAPQTTITKAKKKITTSKRKAKATFEFTADEAGSTFECQLDGKGFSSCASPLKLKVKTGRHTFEARAKDTSGNVDATPAAFAFKVKRKRRR